MKRNLKMLGLAALAAMAIMALLGAGTASATAICKTAENPCAAGNEYEGEIKFSLKAGTSATFKVKNLGTITCNESSGTGKTTKTGTGTLNTIDWTNNGNQFCPTTFFTTADGTALDANGKTEGLWNQTATWLSDNTTGTRNGEMITATALAKFETAGGTTCTYEQTKLEGDMFNPDNTASGKGELIYNKDLMTLKEGGFGCANGEYTATYNLTDSAGNSLYIRNE